MGASSLRAGRFDFFDIVIFEGRNLLRLAVFTDAELLLLEPLDRFSIPVERLHIDFDQVHRRANGAFAERQRGEAAEAAGACCGFTGTFCCWEGAGCG